MYGMFVYIYIYMTYFLYFCLSTTCKKLIYKFFLNKTDSIINYHHEIIYLAMYLLILNKYYDKCMYNIMQCYVNTV